jgi:hypothetical protein
MAGGDEFSPRHAKYSEDAYHAREESAAQSVCFGTHLVTTIARRRRALQCPPAFRIQIYTPFGNGGGRFKVKHAGKHRVRYARRAYHRSYYRSRIVYGVQSDQTLAAFRPSQWNQTAQPPLRRATPKLDLREKLVALASGAHSDDVDLWSLANGA